MEELEFVLNWKMLFIFIVAVIILLIVTMLFAIPVKMANKRGRSGFLWFLFSLITSPFVSMLFIYLLGETEEKRQERIIEDEKLRNLYRIPNNGKSENNFTKWSIENPGQSINDYYKSRK